MQIIIQKNVSEGNLECNPLVDTHTSGRKKGKITDTDNTKRNYPRKILKSQEIPAIVRVNYLDHIIGSPENLVEPR